MLATPCVARSTAAARPIGPAPTIITGALEDVPPASSGGVTYAKGSYWYRAMIVSLRRQPFCSAFHMSMSRSAVQIRGVSMPFASSKARATLKGRQCS